MRRLLIASLFLLSVPSLEAQESTRVIMSGAHPDDCDLKGGGTAILLARLGYAVKFVSVTNGDAGHQTMKGDDLALRREAEATEAGKRFGVEYEVLDNHDGGLEPALEIRLQIIRKIREWNADVLIAPRPNDYHPDHRYTKIFVQDAAYMVSVPSIAPDIPPLKKNPVFCVSRISFKRPNPFRPDVAVDISAVLEHKVHALDAHGSQFYEWLPWMGNYADQVPANPDDRKKWLATSRAARIVPEVKQTPEKWYGKERAGKISHAEAFEICEYGLGLQMQI